MNTKPHLKITSAAIAIACFSAVSMSAVAAVEFNASNWQPDSIALVKQGYTEWAKDLAERSNGDLVAKVFTGSVLLPPAGHLAGIGSGVVAIGYHAGTYTPAELPLDNLLSMVAINYTDTLVAGLAFSDLNMNDPDLLKEWDSHNVVFGGGYATTPYRLFCTTPIETIADIQGKKLRMTGSVASDWAKSVGAVPVNVPSSEMYSGLEKGILDCASNTLEQLKTSSLWDVAKDTTMINIGVYYAGFEYGLNKDFWTSLTADQRREMFDSFSLSTARTLIAYIASEDIVGAEAKEHGVTLHEPAADLAKSVTDYQAIARDSALTAGKEKFGVADPEALLSRFEASIAKWQGLLEGVDRTDEAAIAALIKTEIYDKIDVATYGVN